MRDNGIWSEVLLREFLGWSGRPEILGFDVDVVAYFEVRGRDASSIGWPLITFLGVSHFFTEILV